MQARAAAFAREQVIPAIDGWEQDGRYPRAAVAASGLTGLFCPAAVGGAALSYPEGMAVFEELGGRRALRRSSTLVRGHWLHSSAILMPALTSSFFPFRLLQRKRSS